MYFASSVLCGVCWCKYLFPFKEKGKIAKLLRTQRSRGQYSDGTTTSNNEEIDEIYLDGIASLPTIDELNLEQIKQQVDDIRNYQVVI